MELFEHWYKIKNYLIDRAEKKEPKLDGFTLGCLPSAPDTRTYQFSVLAQSVLGVPEELPESFTSENNLPDCFDQGKRGSCHDDQTEVLTDRGWILFKNLTGEELLASVNPNTSELVFVRPKTIFRIPYNGPMLLVEKRNINFCVTPDHNMLVRKWDEGSRTLSSTYSFVPAKDLGWYVGLMSKVNYNGQKEEVYVLGNGTTKKEIPMRPWLRFLGYFVADGTMYQNGPKDHYRIQLAAQKARKHHFIKKIAEELGFNVHEYQDRFYMFSKLVWEELEKLGYRGCKAPFKFVPSFVFKLSPDLIREFLEGYMMGDGNRSSNRYYTSSRRLADEIQILILLSGSWGTVSSRFRTGSKIKGRTINTKYPEHKISEWQTDHLSLERKNDIKVINYEGIVYCAEVEPYHTLITRRKGKMLIAGNCTASALVWTVKAYQEISQADWPNKGLSVAYLYAEEKKIDGIPDQEGSSIFAGLKVLQKKGVCLETTLPYSSLLNLPAPKVPETNSSMDQEAAKFKINSYAQVCAPTDKQRNENTIKLIKQAIYTNGVVPVAVVVAENFNDYGKNYIIPLPKGYLLGLHAVGLVGWDDKKQAFRLRNSWGKNWGDKGYAWLPYQFVTTGTDMDGYGHMLLYLLETWTVLDQIVIDDAKEIKLIPYNTRAVVDGIEYYVDQPPIIDPTTNRTLVPIRFVSNHMGRVVFWDDKTNEITIKKIN